MAIEIEIIQAEFGSKMYANALEIRDVVLRKPLGMRIQDDNLILDKTAVHLIALLNDEVVGTLVLSKLNKYEFKIRQVAVYESARNSGVGSDMVKFAENIAQIHSAVQIVLHARVVVCGFYQKLGYRIEGEEFAEVGIPHIKMIKYLK